MREAVRLSPGEIAQLACVLEATARKPGNVHRFADFDDCTYLDFILSAAAIVKPLDRAAEMGVGATVFEAVQATRRVVATNTNLGMILLLAPLAAVPVGVPLRSGVARVLEALSVDDARHVYRAIRLVCPGGLGTVSDQDVRDEPTITLLDAMRLAADRDLVARQYATNYRALFDIILPLFEEKLALGEPLEAAILSASLGMMSLWPDTLIARKRGLALAHEAARRAADAHGLAQPLAFEAEPIRAFDAWLRADGHARNPGATADLTAALLHVALAEGTITLPLKGPWSRHVTD